MRLYLPTPTVFLAVCLSFGIAMGCSPSNQPSAGSAPSTHANAAHADDHPTEGPHHGELIELGEEEYHLELLRDSAGVTIYVLDSQAKSNVPIEATEILVNVAHGGAAEQFSVPAAPIETDPAGRASRFEVKNSELASDLATAGTKAKFALTINGQGFVGQLDDHDHNSDHGQDLGHDPDHNGGSAPQEGY